MSLPGARPQPALSATESVLSDTGSWVDDSVTNSILAGGLLLLATLWAVYMYNRLWQGSLREDAAEALASAASRGLTVLPEGLGPNVVAEGHRGSQPVRVVWKGGVWGARTVVYLGDVASSHPIAATASELEAALDAADEAAHPAP